MNLMNTGIEPGLISALGCPGNYVFFFAFPSYFSFLGADVLFLAAFCSLFSAFTLFFTSASEPKYSSSPGPESLPVSLGSEIESYSFFASFAVTYPDWNHVIWRHGTVAWALRFSLDRLSVVVNVILGQVELESVHLAHGLLRDLLGLQELVESTVLVPLNGEGVDSVASSVHFCVKGSVGSARPA